MLAPALDEGLLVVEPGAREAVRFRHDRIREAILAGLDRRGGTPCSWPWRGGWRDVPELFAVAAEQYLPVADAVDDPAERRAGGASCCAAPPTRPRLTGDYALVNGLLAAALRLIDPAETAALVEVHTGRHAALYGIGRLDEADEEYRAIEALCPTALDRADATAVQVRSLTHRNRFAEAIGLGLESLRECGIAVPAADRLAAELDQQFDCLYRWLDHTDPADDLARPELTDPTLLAATRLIDAVLPVAYFVADAAMYRLAGPGGAADLARARPGPHPDRPGRARRLRRCGAARRPRRRVPGGAAGLGAGRGPRLRARDLAGALPVRYSGLLVRADRERCPRGSAGPGGADRRGRPGQRRLHLPTAPVSTCWTARPRWRAASPRSRRGLAFLRRTGNEQTGQWLDSYRWLAGVLRGESSAAEVTAVPTDRTPTIRWPSSTRTSPARSPPPSSVTGRTGAAQRGGDGAAPGRRRALPDRPGPAAARAWPSLSRPAPTR